MKVFKIGEKVELSPEYQCEEIPYFKGVVVALELYFNMAIVKLDNGVKNRISLDMLQTQKV